MSSIIPPLSFLGQQMHNMQETLKGPQDKEKEGRQAAVCEESDTREAVHAFFKRETQLLYREVGQRPQLPEIRELRTKDEILSIRFSQTSIAATASGANREEKINLIEIISQEGWDQNECMHVILMPDGKLTSLDNRRLHAVRQIAKQNPEAFANEGQRIRIEVRRWWEITRESDRIFRYHHNNPRSLTPSSFQRNSWSPTPSHPASASSPKRPREELQGPISSASVSSYYPPSALLEADSSSFRFAGIAPTTSPQYAQQRLRGPILFPSTPPCQPSPLLEESCSSWFEDTIPSSEPVAAMTLAPRRNTSLYDLSTSPGLSTTPPPNYTAVKTTPDRLGTDSSALPASQESCGVAYRANLGEAVVKRMLNGQERTLDPSMQYGFPVSPRIRASYSQLLAKSLSCTSMQQQ